MEFLKIIFKNEDPVRGSAFYLLLLLVLLLPIFFTPGSVFSTEFAKTILIVFVSIISLILFLVDGLQEGRLRFLRTPLFLSAAIIVLVVFLSSIFSDVIFVSLIGNTIKISTFVSIFALFILMFLVTQFFNSPKKILYGYIAFFFGLVLISIFHLLRLVFGADFLTLGSFFQTTSSPIGKWNELSAFMGAGAIFLLISLEELNLGKILRTIFFVLLIIMFALLAVINFTFVWYALGIFSIFYFILKLSRKHITDLVDVPFNRSKEDLSQTSTVEGKDVLPSWKGRFSLPLFITILISIFFIIAGSTISNSIADRIGISALEVRPSWSYTYNITSESLKEAPILGVGPNRFTNQVLKHKLDAVNQTPFWSIDFNHGVGLIPTFFTTTGIVGGLSWVLWIALFLYVGVRSIFTETKNLLSKYLVLSSFFVSAFLWFLTIFYVPSITLFSLAFIFSGLFISSLYISGNIEDLFISFSEWNRKNIVIISVLALLLIGSVVSSYIIGTRVFAFALAGRADRALGDGEIVYAQQNLIRASNIVNSDLYPRLLSQVFLLEIGQIAASSEGGLTEGESNQILQNFQNAILSAQRATEIDPTNYQNWITLGNTYMQLSTFGVEGAYEEAKNSYEQALILNPKNPSIFLRLAQLELQNGNIQEARNNIASARDLKWNYIDAILLLAQIEASEGNNAKTIEQLTQAVNISPNNINLLLQLGLLNYNNSSFEQAIGPLERAVQLSSNYADAKYVLGLSYFETGRRQRAIQQFEELAELLPENEQVRSILDNLGSGNSPFRSSEVIPEVTE